MVHWTEIKRRLQQRHMRRLGRDSKKKGGEGRKKKKRQGGE